MKEGKLQFRLININTPRLLPGVNDRTYYSRIIFVSSLLYSIVVNKIYITDGLSLYE